MVKFAGLKIRPVLNRRFVKLKIFLNELVRIGKFHRGEMCRIEYSSGSESSVREPDNLFERIGSDRVKPDQVGSQ